MNFDLKNATFIPRYFGLHDLLIGNPNTEDKDKVLLFAVSNVPTGMVSVNVDAYNRFMQYRFDLIHLMVVKNRITGSSEVFRAEELDTREVHEPTNPTGGLGPFYLVSPDQPCRPIEPKPKPAKQRAVDPRQAELTYPYIMETPPEPEEITLEQWMFNTVHYDAPKHGYGSQMVHRKLREYNVKPHQIRWDPEFGFMVAPK